MKIILYVICAISPLLRACHNTDSMAEIDVIQRSHPDYQNAQDTGHKLTDLAGKAVIPVIIQDDQTPSTLNKNASPYIGRYRVEISCSDAYVRCEQGASNFILNLLADGTAHRSIVHMGKITFNSSHYYEKDRWSYDEMNHQIIVQRQNGIKFYYWVQPDSSLKMNLEKIAHADPMNQDFFMAGNPLPQKEYVLEKKFNPI